MFFGCGSASILSTIANSDIRLQGGVGSVGTVPNPHSRPMPVLVRGQSHILIEIFKVSNPELNSTFPIPYSKVPAIRVCGKA